MAVRLLFDLGFGYRTRMIEPERRSRTGDDEKTIHQPTGDLIYCASWFWTHDHITVLLAIFVGSKEVRSFHHVFDEDTRPLLNNTQSRKQTEL